MTAEIEKRLAKDGTHRGGARPGAGRPKKVDGVIEKHLALAQRHLAIAAAALAEQRLTRNAGAADPFELIAPESEICGRHDLQNAGTYPAGFNAKLVGGE